MRTYIRASTFFTTLLITVGLSSCLTVEQKEYHITLDTDHSGRATIKFINIMSEADDSADISDDDFQQLIDFYLHGNELEKENPGFRNVKKHLFEENGVLCGEISFTFDSLEAVRVFKYDTNSPYMYAVGSPLSSEQYVESNGKLPRDWMPVIFWPNDTKELYIKTKILSEVSFQRSLLKNFEAWRSNQSTETHDKQ
jgi:hypothetical protein